MMRAKLDAANKETASGKGKRWEGSTRESLAFSADTIFGTGRNGAGSTKQYCMGVNPFKAPMGYKTKGVWSGEAPSGEGWFSAPVKTSKKTEGLRVLTPVREDEKQSSTVKMGKGRKVETEESGEYTCSSGSDWAARYTEEEKELSPVIKWGKTQKKSKKAKKHPVRQAEWRPMTSSSSLSGEEWPELSTQYAIGLGESDRANVWACAVGPMMVFMMD
ncbi:hypothetical protein GE061_011678 [Apolygus lucorum]|uniref:Uncharacterized protein n=1 Tax=Apolygus lucorum TaxID=248454 RepID=A0A6A4K5P6_APOLU|nr:hypothetical protein GE061_011678 [Apolygus lucorum]